MLSLHTEGGEGFLFATAWAQDEYTLFPKKAGGQTTTNNRSICSATPSLRSGSERENNRTGFRDSQCLSRREDGRSVGFTAANRNVEDSASSVSAHTTLPRRHKHSLHTRKYGLY